MAAVALGIQNPARAQTNVAALVNASPISNYDVRARAQLLSATAGLGGSVARQRALEELIEEEIKFQAARQVGVNVSDAEVSEAMDGIAQRANLSRSQLRQAFSQIGVDINTLETRIRADIAWRGVVRSQFRREVQIRENDILFALGDRENQGMVTTTEFSLQQIVFFPSSGAPPSQRRTDADRFRSQFASCETTEELAREFPNAVTKNLRRRTLTQLPEDIRALIENLEAGQISAPRATDDWLELYAVCSRREIQDDTEARVEIQQEIMSEEGDRLARRLLIDMRRRSVIEYR